MADRFSKGREHFDLRALPAPAAKCIRAIRRRANLAILARMASVAVAAVVLGAGASVVAAKAMGL